MMQKKLGQDQERNKEQRRQVENKKIYNRRTTYNHIKNYIKFLWHKHTKRQKLSK